jgi:hypothetical protein
MKRTFKIFIAGVILLSIATSCNKPGTGGNATLVVFLQHHGRTIINHVGYPDTVFVKFNVKELPGLHAGDYDTYFIGNTGEDHVHCPELKAGQYYLFGVGYDSTGLYRVVGGMSYKLKYKDRKSEIDINLAVTE